MTKRTVDWSRLPSELLGVIALSLFSVVELLRFRSVCTSWRSSVPVPGDDNPFPSRPLIRLDPLIVTIDKTPDGVERMYGLGRQWYLSRSSFFRLAPSSSPSQGWLIKYSPGQKYGTISLLDTLSLLPEEIFCGSIDMLKFKVSEIQTSCVMINKRREDDHPGFKRVVLGGNDRVVSVGFDGRIRYWSGEVWTRVEEQGNEFCDIIVHNGIMYALDSIGAVWWISSSMEISKYGPSLDEKTTTPCWKKRTLVGCVGDLYIVDRLLKKPWIINSDVKYPFDSDTMHDNFGITKFSIPKRCYRRSITVGFKVYKMDEESVKWVEVKSLGENAFVMANDVSFSVLANEFVGCVENSIYFCDEEDEGAKMFHLEDGTITTMSGFVQTFLEDGTVTTISEFWQDCFQMLVPRFSNETRLG